MNVRLDNSPVGQFVGATLLAMLDRSELEKPDINRTDSLLRNQKQARLKAAKEATKQFILRHVTEVVAGDGIEPPTQGFSVLCSTD